MITLPEINTALFLASSTILYFVLKYRVHFHIEYEPRQRSRKNPRCKSPASTPKAPASPAAAQMLADLQSALEHLGAGEKEAERMALAVIAEGPGDFDALILRAMQSRDPNQRHTRRRQ